MYTGGRSFLEIPIKLFISAFLLSFLNQPVNNADFIIPVEIDGTVHQVTLLSLCFPHHYSDSFWCSYKIKWGFLDLKILEDEGSESDDIPMGLGLIQVIQDRFVQTSTACSGWLGSGTLPSNANTSRRRKGREINLNETNVFIFVIYAAVLETCLLYSMPKRM